MEIVYNDDLKQIISYEIIPSQNPFEEPQPYSGPYSYDNFDFVNKKYYDEPNEDTHQIQIKGLETEEQKKNRRYLHENTIISHIYYDYKLNKYLDKTDHINKLTIILKKFPDGSIKKSIWENDLNKMNKYLLFNQLPDKFIIKFYSANNNKSNSDRYIYTNKEPDVYEPDKIVFPLDEIKICFSYPFLLKPTFNFMTNNKKGFTNKELVELIISYYNMLLNINYKYDLKTQKLIDPTIKFINNFHSCDTNDSTNSIEYLQYNKENKYFEIIWTNYV